MKDYEVIGKNVPRKEAPDKVTGTAKYTNDFEEARFLHAQLVTSTYAHARIAGIDTSDAEKAAGVRAVLTGKNYPVLTGSTVEDRPVIAIDKVRYHGEPVAVIVADTEKQAVWAASLVKVQYEPLPVVNSPGEASKASAPLLHERLGEYRVGEEIFPKPGTNIANHTKIRKGEINKGWQQSSVIIEQNFSFPQSDHTAMETRNARAEIFPDGKIMIQTSSQSPFELKKLFAFNLGIEPGKIIAHVPFVGGSYGGKTHIQLEFIVYLASKAVGGRPVKLVNTREEDMITSPVHIGLEAKVKLGASSDGKVTAAEITYLFDGGAYADRAVIISRAAAVDCTGPYNIENLWCDSFCMYTNHPYATAFRGFGHPELTFVIERTMDSLAEKLGMDPMELRLRNAILPGDTTPTQTVLDRSTVGNVPACIAKAAALIDWQGEERIELSGNRVRAKGISCYWKNSNTPVNAEGGAILTFNSDGSLNLNCAAVELGQGTKTSLAQILAEKMKMSFDQIHVVMEVNTQTAPDHWKTAASRTTLLIGRAILSAAEDAISQLKATASIVLNLPPEALDVGEGRVFVKENPEVGIAINKIAHGYTFPNGNSVGGQVIGRGKYILENLTHLDPETGKGNPGPEWTVGAAAVEVELDLVECTYRILKAAAVVDAGKVINEKLARGQIAGGMSMGLSFASREGFLFTDKGIVKNPSLRTYKVMHFGDNPEYLVDFVETPHLDGPYGARGIGEYGVIGMPAALSNCLSKAVSIPLNHLPLTPETIWKLRRESE